MAMVAITFVTHSTSLDNEADVASGHFDVALSATGRRQARELGTHFADVAFDAVFCSDLRRAHETARLLLRGRDVPIVQDGRLRECDYGDLTRHLRAEVAAVRPTCIERPFPNGESYRQVAERMRSFLADLARAFDGRRVMIVGHRATHDCLEHLANGLPLNDAIARPWEWQPGWSYEYDPE